ncbi:MAG: hypothetical protein IJL76_02240 [Bacilli bacterium]|nr:hypothetical protein [Bacilli bacterium]
MEEIYNNEEEYIIKNNNYKITDLNFTHYYDDTELGGSSCFTELRIISDYDYIERRFNFKGRITHAYRDYNDEFDIKTIEKSIDITNELVEEINKLNLEELRNNYYNPELKREYWVINYNKLFYIVGTYDNLVDEIKRLLELINYKEIEENCLKEVEKLH